MNLIQITAPRGALDATDRAQLADAITRGVVGGASAPEATLKRARAMTHISFVEADGWTTGDGPLAPGGPPPVLATVTVPDAWREEMAPHMIGVIRAGLRRCDERHGWKRAGGDVWINVLGVPDGSIGLDGRPATAADVLAHMTAEHRAGASAPDDLPDGVAIDPICGMRVRLRPDAITLEHDGDTLGFCSRGCRDLYASEHGIEHAG